MAAPPVGPRRARTTRARRSAANNGSGWMGTTGSRSPSSGSGISPLLPAVRMAERSPRPDQQRLRRVDGAAQVLGDLRDRQAVHVAQGQRRTVMRAERVEHLARSQRVEPRLPGIAGLLAVALDEPQAALLARLPPPVVGQLVPGDA